MMGSLLQSMEASGAQLARLQEANTRDQDGTIPTHDLLVTAANTVTALAQALQVAAARDSHRQTSTPGSEAHPSSSSRERTFEEASPEDITLSPPPSPIAARRSSPPNRPGGSSTMTSLMASPSSSSVSASPLRSEKTQSPCSSGFVNNRPREASQSGRVEQAACQIVTLGIERQERDKPAGSTTPTFPEASVDTSLASEVTRQLSFRVPTIEAPPLDWAAPGVDWASRFEAKDKECSDFQARWQQSQEELIQTKRLLQALQEQVAASQGSSSSVAASAQEQQWLAVRSAATISPAALLAARTARSRQP